MQSHAARAACAAQHQAACACTLPHTRKMRRVSSRSSCTSGTSVAISGGRWQCCAAHALGCVTLHHATPQCIIPPPLPAKTSHTITTTLLCHSVSWGCTGHCCYCVTLLLACCLPCSWTSSTRQPMWLACLASSWWAQTFGIAWSSRPAWHCCAAPLHHL